MRDAQHPFEEAPRQCLALCVVEHRRQTGLGRGEAPMRHDDPDGHAGSIPSPSALPATIPLTAIRGAGDTGSASRRPGTARIGPMLTIGLDGPITTSSAV